MIEGSPNKLKEGDKNNSNVKFFLQGASDADLIQSMQKVGKAIHRYPNIPNLCQKDVFSKYMNICKDKYPSAYEFVPA